MFIYGKGEKKIFPRIPFIVGDGPARRQMVGHFKGANSKFGCLCCFFPSTDQSVVYDGSCILFVFYHIMNNLILIYL